MSEATSNFNFDDSKLARTRQAIKDIKARIDVAETMSNANVGLPDQIRLEETESQNITAEVARYFNEHPASDNIVRLEGN